MEQTATTAATAQGSKGKERAVDPTAVLGLLTDANASVEHLQSHFWALQIATGVAEEDAVSLSSKALGLAASTAGDSLKKRSERMEAVQKRTHEEHLYGSFSAAETAASFVEGLLAAQALKAFVRDDRERVYANRHKFKSVYKAWGSEPLWSATDDHRTTNAEQGFDNHKANWKALTSALQHSNEGPFDAMTTQIVDENFERIGRMLGDEAVKSTVDRVFEHPEYTSFCNEESSGLVIHAYDPDYRQKANSQSIALQRIWKGRLPTSAVSAFAYRFVTEFDGPGHVLMHMAGLCNTGSRAPWHKLGGWAGLFRSLCNQLIAQEPYKRGLKLTRLTLSCLNGLRDKRPRMETYFKLFRDLILDVAEYVVRKKSPAHQIIVVIDGIDWFEERNKVSIDQANRADQPPTPPDSLDMIVQFFRNVVSECNHSDLGTKVHFKYILLHPLSSKIGANPSPTERYITLDKDL